MMAFTVRADIASALLRFSQVLLRVVRPEQGEEGGEGVFRDGDGLADLGQLDVVFDHAQLLDAIGGRLPVERGGGIV